jgi:hypothetical protein
MCLKKYESIDDELILMNKNEFFGEKNERRMNLMLNEKIVGRFLMNSSKMMLILDCILDCPSSSSLSRGETIYTS